MILTDKKFIDQLIEKFVKGEKFTHDEKDNFYYLDGEKYVCCNNETGDCWWEEFYTIQGVNLYFYSNIDIMEILEIDKIIHKYNQIKNILE